MADVAVKRFDELESYQNQFLYAGRGSHRCRARPDGLVLGVYVAPQLTAPGAALLLAIFGVMWLTAVHTAYDTFAGRRHPSLVTGRQSAKGRGIRARGPSGCGIVALRKPPVTREAR